MKETGQTGGTLAPLASITLGRKHRKRKPDEGQESTTCTTDKAALSSALYSNCRRRTAQIPPADPTAGRSLAPSRTADAPACAVQLALLGVWICLDTLLHMAVMLPLRAALGLLFFLGNPRCVGESEKHRQPVPSCDMSASDRHDTTKSNAALTRPPQMRVHRQRFPTPGQAQSRCSRSSCSASLLARA